jgi:hypothetical protein
MTRKQHYIDYYNNQIGGSLPHFAGVARMRGHGFGSMLNSFWRWAKPIVIPALGHLKSEGLKTAINVLNDVSQDKKPIKESVKRNLKNAGSNFIRASLKDLEGGGRLKIKRAGQSRRGRPVKDIFA